MPSSDGSWPRDVAVDSDENVWVGGRFNGAFRSSDKAEPLDLGFGPVVADFNGDRFIAKLDPSGTLQWMRGHLGEVFALDKAGNAIVVDDRNDAVSLVKLASDGHEISRSEIVRSSVIGRGAGVSDLLVDAEDHVVATGIIRSNSTFLGSEVAVAEDSFVGFVVKLGADGTAIFGRVFGPGRSDQEFNAASGDRVDVDSHGKVLVTGTNFGGLDFLEVGPLVEPFSDFIAMLDETGRAVWVKEYADVVAAKFSDTSALALALQPFRVDRVELDGSNVAQFGNLPGDIDKYSQGDLLIAPDGRIWILAPKEWVGCPGNCMGGFKTLLFDKDGQSISSAEIFDSKGQTAVERGAISSRRLVVAGYFVGELDTKTEGEPWRRDEFGPIAVFVGSYLIDDLGP